jgi:hypothetical protein
MSDLGGLVVGQKESAMANETAFVLPPYPDVYNSQTSCDNSGKTLSRIATI